MPSDRTTLPPRDARRLIADCLSDELALRMEARRAFQDEYGQAIYYFPIKIGGLSEDEAGDFYLYVFEADRLFLRLRTFQGRNNIHFRTFLSYYVLKSLFFEWLRTRKYLDTVSLDAPLAESSTEDARTVQDLLPSETSERTEDESERIALAQRILMMFTLEERLIVKLLTLAECELNQEDLRLLAALSHRPLDDVLLLIAEVRGRLIQKDEKYARLQGELDSTWGWILLRQREMQQMDEEMHLLEQQGDADTRETRQHRMEIEAKLSKRLAQRQKILHEIRALKLTTPYKDVAQLLNWPLGMFSARLTRLRERMVQSFGETWRQGGEAE